MFHQDLKSVLDTALSNVSSNISLYVNRPGKDLSRNRKLPPETIMSFLISQGASSTKCEMLDFFNMSTDRPSLSALNQQRAKLKPEAFEAVFHEFNTSVHELVTEKHSPKYRFLAADGSAITFHSLPRFSTDEYFVSEGHSAKGFYSMHINAFYDLETKTYTDAYLQPVHDKDEFSAFCKIVDRHEVFPGTKNIYIGDRGYCSYNNMAHVIEQGQYFLLRTKDIHSKGLVGKFHYPDSDTFDIDIHVTLVRSKKKSLNIEKGSYRRFVDAATSFDFIEYGSQDTYEMTFRVVRFLISEDTYECIVTNLPQEEFPMERIKETYNSRWGIETSFRKLKYTIGLTSYHSYKPEYICQEVWAKLIAYNASELLVQHTVTDVCDRKYAYSVNFTVAAHICRIYLRLTTEIDSIDVMSLLKTELVPIRNDRQFPRLKTAHFRKPKYPVYRAA